MKKIILTAVLAMFSTFVSAQRYEVVISCEYVPDMCIHKSNGGPSQGQEVQIWENNGNNNMRWIMQYVSYNTFILRSIENPDYVIGLKDGQCHDGSELALVRYTGAMTQKWQYNTDGWRGITSAFSPIWYIFAEVPNGDGNRNNWQMGQKLRLHQQDPGGVPFRGRWSIDIKRNL